MAAPARAEVALALGAEYDPRRLRPGHQVIVEVTPGGEPRRVPLKVEDGLQVEAIFGDTSTTRVVSPEPEIVTLAGEARIETIGRESGRDRVCQYVSISVVAVALEKKSENQH